SNTSAIMSVIGGEWDSVRVPTAPDWTLTMCTNPVVPRYTSPFDASFTPIIAATTADPGWGSPCLDCTTSSDCPSGQSRNAFHKCEGAACTTNSNCPGGFVCNSGHCQIVWTDPRDRADLTFWENTNGGRTFNASTLDWQEYMDPQDRNVSSTHAAVQ